MASVDAISSEIAFSGSHISEFRRVLGVLYRRKAVLFAISIILMCSLVALLAPYLSPYDPYQQDLISVLLKPSAKHWLGTDVLGRDVLSRIIYGTQVSFLVGIVAVGIAALIGMALGLVAGYYGGILNMIIMRCIDGLMAIPTIVLALAIAVALGGGIWNVMTSLGISLVPTYCRLMCGQVLSVKEEDYVMVARIMGSSNLRIIFRHILPNCFPSIIVLVTLNLGIAILSEAALSFLGVGISPPGAAWGSMVNDGYRYLSSHPLLSLAPGVCIMAVVLSFSVAGDGLRDALDPRLRGMVE